MTEHKKEEIKEFGLGTKTGASGYRTLRKDGSFNVRKINVPFLERINFFHFLISMPWYYFLIIILLGYFIVNIFFASIYTVIGIEFLTGIEEGTIFQNFLEAFFFSAQTITTLGYGRVAPIGILVNCIAAVESMLGLLSFAMATGLLYGRFSKPTPFIKYSPCAVIAPFDKGNGFMFKIVNPKNNQLIEVEAKLSFSMKRTNSEIRDYYQLDLQIPKIMFFPYMWTIVHPITKESPLYNLNEKTMAEKDVEFIVIINAFDESFSQTVYSRSSYKAEEIKWGQKFVYTVKQDNESTVVDVGRLGETELVNLN